ncbi:unnamed protein product [Closterium sp. NIES-54]
MPPYIQWSATLSPLLCHAPLMFRQLPLHNRQFPLNRCQLPFHRFQLSLPLLHHSSSRLIPLLHNSEHVLHLLLVCSQLLSHCCQHRLFHHFNLWVCCSLSSHSIHWTGLS